MLKYLVTLRVRIYKMKIRLPIFALSLFISIILSCSENKSSVRLISNTPTLISYFENGSPYISSGNGNQHFNILVLKGNWREMGRQYGHILKDQMADLYKLAIENLKVNYDQIKYVSELFYDGQYQYIQEFISGIAETSGFSIEKQKVICSLIFLISANSRHQFGCSTMSAWGKYTGGNPLVIGRNLDQPAFISFKKFVTIVIYNPTGSPSSFADVTYVGAICYVPTSLNSNGLYVDMHSGTFSDPKNIRERSFSFSSMLLDSIINCPTITVFEERLLDSANLPPLGVIINIANVSECRVYELATYNVEKRTSTGLIVSSNHFINPTWEGLPAVPSGSQGGFSLERIENLRALGKQYKGSINAAKMMEIFNRGLFEKGPTVDSTIFQVVTVPYEKIMWVKIPGLSDWDKVDLNLFIN
jgi:hypothetical protein